MVELDKLNEPQREAVLNTEGQLLILAGAGSGKTRVVTTRIAHLVDDLEVSPYNILAITFTNKAAGEMKQRVEEMVEGPGEGVWVSTFHSACVRILRRYIDRLGGFDNHFTIYDTDDAKSVIKAIVKEKGLNPRDFKEGAVYGAISWAKNHGQTAESYAMDAKTRNEKDTAFIFEEYQRRLKSNNALDFDDLLSKTVELLETDAEVREGYQRRFRYIHVDEYQDTNQVQLRLIQLLAGTDGNLCVVGDDDQSIYKFRGADIGNILNFEHFYPKARVIRLEQNYRSTSNILNTANSVIRNNTGRKQKTLWSERGEGSPVRVRQVETAYEEAGLIADEIRRGVRTGEMKYGDCAVLYRTNAQSRLLEEQLVMLGLPYKVVGGVNFYSRKEIKDILAYLKTIDNGLDGVAIRRIINVPRRGIGAASLAKLEDFAQEENLDLLQAMLAARDAKAMGRAAEKFHSFATMIMGFRARMEFMSLKELVEEVLDNTGYRKDLEESDEDDAPDRLENIEEFLNKVISYEESDVEEASLTDFLENVSLVADVEAEGEEQDRVTLMTLHAAKGLEFPRVYLSGMEDGIFPSYMSIMSMDEDDIEEERRLAYVGITRAMNSLTLTAARSRMVHGETRRNVISRFVREMDPAYLDGEGASLLRRLNQVSRGYDRYGDEDDDLPFGGYSSTGGFASASYGGGTGYGSGFGASSKLSSPVNTYKAKKAVARPGTPKDQKPFIANQAKANAALTKGTPMGEKPDYVPGDRVAHVKFGEGTVLELTETQRDYRVKVSFDGAGEKIMFAAFAKLVKIDK